MSDEGQPAVRRETSLQKSASDRAFELFLCAAREIEGIGAKGAKSLQDLFNKGGQPTAAEIISTLFPERGRQSAESQDVENQASEG